MTVIENLKNEGTTLKMKFKQFWTSQINYGFLFLTNFNYALK